MSTNIGTIELLATIDTSRYKKGANEIDKANKDMESSTEKSSGSFVKMGAVVGAVAGAVQVAFTQIANVISSTVGNAVKRVDTLNNSTRTFENMGFATQDVETSMNALQKSIMGMPTPLDDAVRGMTALSATYGDIRVGQKVFTALNNGILGFGGSAEMVNNAIQQISQLPMKGPLDAQTWNSLRNSGLTPVLVAMSKDMGISIGKLKEDLGSGKLTVEDFMNSLIKMNEKGGGGLKSLEQIAKDSTKGISTGWANMQTAISRGLASVIEAIGSENISNAITAVGSGFEKIIKAASNLISAMKELKDWVVGVFAGDVTSDDLEEGWFKNVVRIAEGVKSLTDNLKELKNWIVGVFAGDVTSDDLESGWFKSIVMIAEAANSFFKTIKDNLPFFMGFIQGLAESFLPNIQGIAGAITEKLLPGLARMWESIMRIYNALQPGLMVVIKAVAALIGITLLGAFKALLISIEVAINVVSFFITIIGTLIGWIGNLIGWIGTASITIIKAFGAAIDWLRDNWPIIIALLTGPIGVAILAIIRNFDKIREIAGTVVGWFKDIGSAIGNALGNAFKTAVNAILGFLENRINSIVDVMNNAIHLVDNITPGGLDRIGRVALPRLAQGGIVTRPTIAEIGEGGEAEAVIPLSKLDDMMNGNGGAREYNIGTINIASEVDGERWIRRLTDRQEMESSGITPTQSYMG